MKKETVVTFDGEDSFILPRNHSFNRRKGYAEFVGQDGATQPEVTKKTDSVQGEPSKSTPTPPPPPASSGKAPIVVDNPADTGDVNKPVNPDVPPGGGQTGGGTSGSYTNYSVGKFNMPDPTSPNFCENVNEFILTNGGGIATPPEITAARAAIAKYCSDKPPVKQDPGTPTPPADTPKDDTPKGDIPKDNTPKDDTPKGDGSVNNLPKTPSGKTILPKPKLPKEPKAPSIVTVPVIENLGLPIGTIPVVKTDAITGGGFGGGGGMGGGGGEEEKPPVVEQKKSYWWLLFVAAAVAGGIYYYRRR